MSILIGQSNIDDIRAEIMRLESAPTFDQADWNTVLGALRCAGRLSAAVDAERRMETARNNASSFIDEVVETVETICIKTDLGIPGNEIDLQLIHVSAVSAETSKVQR